MLFNSWTFVWFFVVVYLAYLRLGHVGQNRLLLVAGFVFYGCWDWRFLGLLLATTVIDYGCALAMVKAGSPRRRRLFLLIAIVTNLGSLGFFKYCDFFVASLVEMGRWFGVELAAEPLGILLPVGISFYTFQEMSYVVDVHRGSVAPCRSLRDYCVYVTYFPQLVAGPIERGAHLIGQVVSPRVITWRHVREGLWLSVQGFFLKVVVADNAAIVADGAFDTWDGTGAAAMLGMLAFALQIYGDFAGYSNIARGTAALMGFDLMVNFRRPYFATSPSDFWRRWHISLSTWLRDYLYIPLGGNRRGPLRTNCNLMATMLLGGLWHGASWKFVLWGGYHGLLLAGGRLLPEPTARWTPGNIAYRLLAILVMFQLTCIGWLVFRCNEIGQVPAFLHSMVTNFQWNDRAAKHATTVACLAMPLFLFDAGAAATEALARGPGQRDGALARWCRSGATIGRLLVATLMLALIYLVGVRQGTQFIYFQF